jgi:hypothetical protein
MAKKQKAQITRQPVDSSTLHSVGYDPITRTLEIAFKKKTGEVNAVWQYEPITEEAYRSMMSSDSLGSYFHKHIRDNTSVNSTKIS